MMNRFEGPATGEARVRYLDADYEVITPGGYVYCAVSAEAIPLEELKYWSVARQEAYVDARRAYERETSGD